MASLSAAIRGGFVKVKFLEDSMIFPRDTGHRVKNHIMIRNEVLDEEATQKSQS